jgi:arylsulfotransferase ASST
MHSHARLVWLFAALALGCQDAPRPSDRARAPQPSPDPDAIDRLRALGYIGFVPPGKDRPEEGVATRQPASSPGYNLFTSPHLCTAALVDESGALKNVWHESPCGRWYHAELSPAGDVLVLGTDPGEGGEVDESAAPRFLARFSWTGERVWKRPLAVHHDLKVTPDGLLLTLLTRLRRLPQVHASLPVRDNRVALLSPEGVEIDSVSLYDAWSASPGAPPLQEVRPDRGEIDLLHANSVELLPAPPPTRPRAPYAQGDVLVCVRHQDAAVIVDWKARRLRWAWGRGEVSGPHDATLLANGNVLLFDNGLSRRWSRVVEVDPVPPRIVWQYEAPAREEFFTLTRGSSQRLPDGHTLIVESDRGRAFEVTPRGHVVWEFFNPLRNRKGERAAIMRMRRVDRARIDAIVSRRGEGSRVLPGDLGRDASAPPAARGRDRPR